MNLIGLDVGTTGCKSVAFDPDGRILGYAFREYGVDTDANGKGEQDAEAVFSLCLETLTEVVGKLSDKNVAAMSVSLQGDAAMLLDSNYKPLAPAVLGMDYRCRDQIVVAEKCFGEFDYFQRTGMRPHPMNFILKAMWLKKHRQKEYAMTHRVSSYADFVLSRLKQGDAGIDMCMASRTMAFNLEKCDWDEDILRQLGVDRGKLSPIGIPGTPAGGMSPAVAKMIGFANRPILVYGGHDQAVCALGAGATKPGHIVDSAGTAEVLSTILAGRAISKDMFDSHYPCYYSVLPGRYFTFALNHYAGALFRWHRDALSHQEVLQARQEGRNAYELMTERMPAKPSRLLMLPYFLGQGTPNCDLDAKGAIIGLTPDSTRHDITKAILESLCFEMRLNLERMREIGIPFDMVTCVGGASRSDAWMQLKADIFSVPVRTLRNKEAGCLGGAILAGTAAGVYRSAQEGAEATVNSEAIFEPKSDETRYYNERFALYRELANALNPINRKL